MVSFRGILAAALVAVLAACSGHAPLPPPPPVAVQPQLVDPDSACLQDLTQAHARFQPLGSFGEGHCSIANPVKISGTDTDWSRPGILTCSMASTLVHFEAEVIQPLAMHHFGQPVRRILHLGTYDCRTQRNETTAAAARLGTSKGGRLSEHARGRAIDLSGVELADGTMVTVKNQWRAGGAAGAFLHELARASCHSFNVVLTPNHDRFHQDHIHLDIGPHMLCGI